jgi:hypothetical protein
MDKVIFLNNGSSNQRFAKVYQTIQQNSIAYTTRPESTTVRRRSPAQSITNEVVRAPGSLIRNCRGITSTLFKQSVKKNK